MSVRGRALVSIGLVLVVLAAGLGLVADPLVRRTLTEHRELSSRMSALHRAALGSAEAELRPPPECAVADAAVERLWIVVGLACIVAPLLCGIALRTLFGPVGALQRACQRVDQWGSLPPLDERRSDELGLLCAAFDRMTAKVAQSRRRRERHHEQLETTVTEKTRQLAATVERLRSLDQMKDAFLACASSELQSPVRSILDACDELGRPASAEPRPEVLRRVLSDCRQIDRMTQEILDFVRTSSEGFDYRFAPTTVQAVVRRALATVRDRMPRTDVEFELEPLGDCAVVWDANWISRVFESMLVHVLQRAPSGSIVYVEHRVQGPDVRIQFRFDSLATAHGATVSADPSRIGRAVWTPVLGRHLGEWSERVSDTDTSLVVVLPAQAEHLRWRDSTARVEAEASR